MYTLKTKPEDFIVEEIVQYTPNEGPYTYFLLKKKNYTTMKAVKTLANYWGIPEKNIGFAGLKDRHAITTQLCSVRGFSKERIEGTRLTDIELTYVGTGTTPIQLADLRGNKFTIALRDVKELPPMHDVFVNYFGEQRFSTNNATIGKLLVKKNYKDAVQLMLESGEENRTEIAEHLSTTPNDYIGALKRIPKTMLMLYIRSYQSYLWNTVVSAYVQDHTVDLEKKIPLYGFDIEFEDSSAEELYDTVLAEEEVSERDFINKTIPHLSAEGIDRLVWIQAKDLHHEYKDATLTLTFTLSKGSYATEFVKQLFNHA